LRRFLGPPRLGKHDSEEGESAGVFRLGSKDRAAERLRLAAITLTEAFPGFLDRPR
jgi:hypothetical protein